MPTSTLGGCGHPPLRNLPFRQLCLLKPITTISVYRATANHHPCLSLWERCPSAHTGAERAPSQSRLTPCQLSHRESQGRSRAGAEKKHLVSIRRAYSVYQISAAPKPPSDEGGGFAVRRRRRERKLPLSQPVRLTAPLTRGALGASAPEQQVDKF